MITFPSRNPDPYQLADWIEAETLFGESARVDVTQVAASLHEQFFDEQEEDPDDPEVREQQKFESPSWRLAAEAFALIRDRASQVGPTYPIAADAGVAEIRDRARARSIAFSCCAGAGS